MTPEQHQELILLVGGMDAKLDVVIDHTTDLRKRVSALEATKQRLVGILTAAGALLGYLNKEALMRLIGLI